MISNEIIAIYLAAGNSSRMGENKLSLPLSAFQTVGSSSLRTALNSLLDHVIVVTKRGDSLDWIEGSLFDDPYSVKWSHVVCEDSKKGQAHSLQSGIKEAMNMDAHGVMVLLADQPFLSQSTINQLILKYSDQKDFVAARYKGVPRPPVIFSKRAFRHLLQLKGDKGARTLLTILDGVYLDGLDERDLIDIDTKAEYEKILGGQQVD